MIWTSREYSNQNKTILKPTLHLTFYPSMKNANACPVHIAIDWCQVINIQIDRRVSWTKSCWLHFWEHAKSSGWGWTASYTKRYNRGPAILRSQFHAWEWNKKPVNTTPNLQESIKIIKIVASAKTIARSINEIKSKTKSFSKNYQQH